MADSQVLKALLPDNPLCGISTYKDTLNLATGACTRQIYKLVLHGTESYGKNVTGTYQYYMAVNPLHKKVPICVCSHLPSVDDYPADVIGVHTTRWANNAVYLNFGEDVMLAQPSGNTVDGLKEYITAQYNAGTPVTIWYIMETATTETIPVSSGLTGTVDGYLTQSGTPSPSAPIYPTANTVNVWVHSLRKLTTATEAVESPLYSDGTAITAYTIKGNTVQSGTPTPSNPVEVNGVGNKTANLFTTQGATNGKYIDASGNEQTSTSTVYQFSHTDYLKVEPNTAYTFSLVAQSKPVGTNHRIIGYNSNKVYIEEVANLLVSENEYGAKEVTFTTSATCAYITINYVNNYYPNTSDNDIMLNTGSTAKPYEPSGYKIPISSNGAALTPMYFSQQLFKIGDTTDDYSSSGTVTYNTNKYVLTGNENWLLLESGSGSTEIYQFYTDGLALGGIAFESALSNIAPYGMTVNTRTSADFGVYLITSGTNIGFQMRGAKSSFADVTAWKTYLQQQYTAGTPVTIYYVLASPTTETITAPSIPTTDGANTITVDTTVQPSEFTATWTGWHDSSVKEYDGTDWQ